MTFGVRPTGFVIKPLSDILTDLEEANLASSGFGPDVIQTAQSPLGQWNGLRADAIASVWGLALDTYQSLDPDQAEGNRLDMLGRLRNRRRLADEDDGSFARAITNEGRANFRNADFERDVRAVEGVTWARVYSNDSGEISEEGLPPNSVTVAALGGSDEEIARVAFGYITAGITVFGNTAVEVVIEGLCETVHITRPTTIPVRLEVDVISRPGDDDCPAPPAQTIAQEIALQLTGENRLPNAVLINEHVVRSRLFNLPNVEVTAIRFGRGNDEPFETLPYTFSFFEVPSFDLSRINVHVA